MAQQSHGVYLSVRSDSSMKKALKEIARKKYLTLTQVILEALREKLEKEKK
jgi:predicted transcriptional regulator